IMIDTKSACTRQCTIQLYLNAVGSRRPIWNCKFHCCGRICCTGYSCSGDKLPIRDGVCWTYHHRRPICPPIVNTDSICWPDTRFGGTMGEVFNGIWISGDFMHVQVNQPTHSVIVVY